MYQTVEFASSAAAGLPTQARQVSCSSCSLHQLCLPTGLDAAGTDELDSIISCRRKVPKDTSLYHMGDSFTNLYAVRLGHFKTHQVSADGAEQITGFQMAGELLGLDAISSDRHNCYAVALEDSEVCEIPYARLEALFTAMPPLLRHFHRTMSQEITRDQSNMLLLGNMRAEQRFAAFLTNLSARYKVRGYSTVAFQLRMSREDIGNYLGLTIESISRLLSRFKKSGLINVANRDIELLDLPALKTMALGAAH